MYPQVVKFCSNISKHLVLAAILLATVGAFAFLALDSHANSLLIHDLDSTQCLIRTVSLVALGLTGLYWLSIVVLNCLSARGDTKNFIAGVAVLTSLTFLLSVGLLVAVWATNSDYQTKVATRAKESMSKYDFTDKPANTTAPSLTSSGPTTNPNDPQVLNSTAGSEKQRAARMAADEQPVKPRALNETEATQFWDHLQGLGCCGFTNSTTDWTTGLPKSCCAPKEIKLDGKKYFCDKPDSAHERPCKQVVDSLSTSMLIALALAALVNLAMATLTGMSTCKHFHYTEANQNAYS